MSGHIARAGIVGTAQSRYRTHRPDVHYAELVQQTAFDVLADAGMTIDDIDAIVFAMAPTDFVGITDVDKWAIGAIGGAGKPFMRVQLGGATGVAAAQAGYFHAASGEFDNVLVIGADKVAETPDGQHVLSLMFDPFYERESGLNTITMAALHAEMHMRKYGTTTEHLDQVAIRAWRRAQRNPHAHLSGILEPADLAVSPLIATPLRRYDVCPRSTGAAGVIISSERAIARDQRDAAWVTGVGAIANSVFIGDRTGADADLNYADWGELRLAADQAYAQAGITDPASQLDVVEIYAPFTICEVSGVEALGLCAPGEGGPALARGDFDTGAAVEVNPSGGTLCANPIAVTGLVRVCDAAAQLLNRAGDMQKARAQRAVATAVGGTFQFQSVMVMDRQPQED
ncbi:thiolase family protein [Nocardioides daejeonensis]|uniref:thiolase family protein n=1 Tax=Nocardioides daejeonensis TaxID=1046556 RepID=UPI000D743840|nr:thiolase family protein [Nocardioides daejeonensis]